MKALAAAVHAKGLKLGIYSDAGTMTCAKRPGSKDHEAQDAKTYAEWGVDYLKYDWCNTEGLDARDAYLKMSRALRASGRPIVFSICEWGSSKPWTWAQGVGQLWRATGDIQDCWDCGKSWGGMGVVHIIDLMADLHPFSGPGHFNDPDMLEVGNGGLTVGGEPLAFQFLGALRRAFDGRQRPRGNDARDPGDPHQPRGDRRSIRTRSGCRGARCATTARTRSG